MFHIKRRPVQPQTACETGSSESCYPVHPGCRVFHGTPELQNQDYTDLFMYGTAHGPQAGYLHFFSLDFPDPIPPLQPYAPGLRQPHSFALLSAPICTSAPSERTP